MDFLMFVYVRDKLIEEYSNTVISKSTSGAAELCALCGACLLPRAATKDAFDHECDLFPLSSSRAAPYVCRLVRGSTVSELLRHNSNGYPKVAVFAIKNNDIHHP